MELGALLKQARLEAGLSQRQLCGDTVTRNMLSQIENGSARPSMETLRILAARLEKPVSYFLEEQAVLSPNQPRIAQAREALAKGAFREVLEALKGWKEPDPVFDPERRYLEALAAISQSEIALAENRQGYALELLDKAKAVGSLTPYYTEALEYRRLTLCYRAKPEDAPALAALLPDWARELLLPAEAALRTGDPLRCAQLLDAVPQEDPRWQLLRAEAAFQNRQYREASVHYALAEAAYPEKALRGLEACCRELEDYKMAYHYACRLRELQSK